MKNKKIQLVAFFLLLFLTVCLSCSSCSSASVYDTSNLSYCTAMGIDRFGDKIQVSLQIVNAAAMKKQQSEMGSGSGSSSFAVISAKANTIGEALSLLKQQNSRQFFYKTILSYVLHPNLTESDIRNFYDFVIRQRETKIQSYLFCVRDGTAEEILLAEPLSGETSGAYLAGLLRNQAGDSIYESGILTTLKSALEQKINLLLCAVRIKNDQLVIDGAGIYGKDGCTFQGYLESDMVKLVNLVRNRSKNLSFSLNETATVTIPSAKTAFVWENDCLTAKINVKFSLTDTKQPQEYASVFNEILTQKLESTYQLLQEDNLDLFGVELYFYKYQHSLWKNFSYADTKMKFTVNSTLKDSGLLKLHRTGGQ